VGKVASVDWDTQRPFVIVWTARLTLWVVQQVLSVEMGIWMARVMCLSVKMDTQWPKGKSSSADPDTQCPVEV
jgi:hypothetical protein